MREATIHVPDGVLESFGIGEFVSLVRAAGLERLAELQCRRPGCLLVVEVIEPIRPDRLSSLESLEWWERVDGDGGVTYMCELAVPAMENAFDPPHETGVAEEEVVAVDNGVEIRIVGEHEDVAERVADYERPGTRVVLRSVGRYEGPAAPLDALSRRQYDVLRTAFDAGYFEVPREATTEEVAAALDLSPATVREHLQRAQRNLLAELLRERQSVE
jgi:DNA-binding CsgD family transcriptional regulator